MHRKMETRSFFRFDGARCNGRIVALASLLLQIAATRSKLAGIERTMQSPVAVDAILNRYSQLYDSLL